MGEYAKRLKDGVEVKIGTCEDMKYCRYDQIKDVIYPYPTADCLWRIPTPQEDGIDVGDFKSSLLRSGGYIPYEISLEPLSNELSECLCKSTGIVQVRAEELGLLVNIPCYHGLKLPDAEGGVKFFWNGKRDALHLHSLKNCEKEMCIVIQCAACRSMWSSPFNEIQKSIKSLWMRLRLLHICTEYWYAHNSEPCTYYVVDKDGEGNPMEICHLTGEKDGWFVDVNGETILSGSWEQCRDKFIELLGQPKKDWAKLDSEEWAYYNEIKNMKERYLSNNKSN